MAVKASYVDPNILVNLFNGVSAKNVLLYEAYDTLHNLY